MITCELIGKAPDKYGRVADLLTILTYTKDDPYAVTISFRSNFGDVVWHASREVLRQGTHGHAGEGDLRVHLRENGAEFVIDLSSPDGKQEVAYSTRDLSNFLFRTYQLVPDGTESKHLDLDALLAEILDVP